MNATDPKALRGLSEVLADAGWVIYKYEVIGSDSVALTIARKEPDGEGGNG